MQHQEDAITLLTEDHKKVKKLFADFAKKMFPKAKKAKVYTAALGAALTRRKHELQAERGESEPVKTRKAQAR